MSDILKQLKEEAKRMDDLHVKVEETCRLQRGEMLELRSEKARHIYDFLSEYKQFLKDHDLLESYHDSFDFFVTYKREKGGYLRDCWIKINLEGIYACRGSESGPCEEQTIGSVMRGNPAEFAASAVIDRWSDHHERTFEKDFANFVKPRLNKRIKEDEMKLKESEDTLKKLKGE